MAAAEQIRDLITQTTSGTLPRRVPPEVRDASARMNSSVESSTAPPMATP